MVKETWSLDPFWAAVPSRPQTRLLRPQISTPGPQISALKPEIDHHRPKICQPMSQESLPQP